MTKNKKSNIANYDISLEEESPDDTYVTINNINMIREMNKAQMNIDPEIGEEVIAMLDARIPTSHG